jgi:hypothetical protein
MKRCPFCNPFMKGKTVCEAHEREVSERAASYNLSRSDAMDQLWTMYESFFREEK